MDEAQRELQPKPLNPALASHKRWSRDLTPVPFGLVIRIEDTGAQVPIYTAITTEIDVLVEQRVSQ